MNSPHEKEIDERVKERVKKRMEDYMEKYDDLVQRYHEYNQDEELKEMVEAWENETNKGFKGFFKHSGFRMHPQLRVTMDGMPMFQFLMDNGRINILWSTDKHIAFIPAGFNKDKNDKLEGDKLSPEQFNSLKVKQTDLSTINPVQHRLAGDAALMSLLHVLVIPKLDYMRVFNAVTLPGKKYDFEDAKVCGEKALEILKEGGADEVGSLAFWLKQTGKLEVRDDDLSVQNTVYSTVRPLKTAKNYTMNIKHSFHVYGNNSIGYLHMHVYDGNLLTKAYDEMKGDSKNTPVDVVQPWAEGMSQVLKEMQSFKKAQSLKKAQSSRYTRVVPHSVSVHPAYETPPPALAPKPKANAHPRFKNLRH